MEKQVLNAPYSVPFNLDDLRNKTCSSVMQQLGLGENSYSQNIPESVNFMIKDGVIFLPSEVDRFIVSLQDLVQSFMLTEEELTWFGLSDTWAVKEEFKCTFYSRNNICCHTVTVAWKTGTLSRVLETYMGRNMNNISISTVSSSVGKKKSAAGFKRN